MQDTTKTVYQYLLVRICFTSEEWRWVVGVVGNLILRCSFTCIGIPKRLPPYIRGYMPGSDQTCWLPNQTRCCQYTGSPLDRLTGTSLADAITQWYSSGNQELFCIIGTHWKTTGATSTLGCHWNHTGWCHQWCFSGNPVVICIIGTYWKITGAHWKHTDYQQFCLQWHSSVHWGLRYRHTGLPLDYHWITTGSA